MKQIKLTLVIFTAAILLLTGCGRQDAGETEELPVYASSLIWDDIGNRRDFAVAGDSLYYLEHNSEYIGSVYRMSLADIADIGLTTELEKETVLTAQDILSALPIDELDIVTNMADLISNAEGFEEGTETGIQGDAENVEVGVTASVLDYAVDTTGEIYGIVLLRGIDGISREDILYKQSPEGEMVYWLELPEMGIYHDLAVGRDGTAYVLTGNAILEINKKGKQTGSLSIAEDLQQGHEINGRLLEGEKGDVYYAVEKLESRTMEAYLINEKKTLQMTKIPKLSGGVDMKLYGDRNGLLQLSGEMLYSYHRADDSLVPILELRYCNVLQNDIWEAVRIDEEHFFVTVIASSVIQQKGLLLTEAGEGTYKETIVIVSLFPDDDLKRSVAEFNQSSDEYFVLIESYGADIYGGAANDGAYVRLDSSLVSDKVPDLLDLSDLDVCKYAENGALEDLRPYLEENLQGNLDYSDSLLECYTIDGRLVSIPKAVYFRQVFAISPEVRSLESWTLPQLMRLTEEYPEKRLFDRLWQPDEYLLEEFCAPYYLEQFVDWEGRTCSFDSEEFYSLLKWIKDQSERSDQEGDALLAVEWIYNFEQYLGVVMEYGEETAMAGCPSADGKGVYTAMAEEALAILSGSQHKEGAWEFLQYFLSEDTYGSGFPTRRELLDEMALDAVTPRYTRDQDGNPMICAKGTIYIDGAMVEFYALEQEQADEVMRLIEFADYTPRKAEELMIVDIVAEETQYFFGGSKSVEEVCAVIQNKTELLLQERGSGR